MTQLTERQVGLMVSQPVDLVKSKAKLFKVNKRLGKQIVVHSDNGMPSCIKEEWTTKMQSSIGQSSKYYSK